MVYHLTKSIIHLALRGLFRKIHVVGFDNIPPNSPAIFISNHPSALIDPLVVSIIFRKRIHFIAGAEFFGKGFKNWLLRHEFNMIPVYRPKEDKKVDNTEMFSECYKTLEKNGSILVFPEGSSVTEHRLRSFKTGTIRILTGFHKVNPKKHVHVIPIGLNYDDAHRFRSDITVKIGPPIDPEKLPFVNGSKEAIKEMSEVLEEGLRNEIFHIDNYELNPLISNISEIFSHNLRLDSRDPERDFSVKKKMIDAVIHFQETAPKVVEQVKEKIETYFEKIKNLKINHHLLDSKQRRLNPLKVIQLVLFLPVFLIGLCGNLLPFLMTRTLYKIKYHPRLIKNSEHEKPINPAFSATVSFAIGTLIFLFWFLGISITIGVIYHWWAGLIAFISLYLLGQFSTWYRGLGDHLFARWRINRTFRRHKPEVQKLIQLRKEILTDLEKHQKIYESQATN
ncbi:MAG: lysophospholipid acyltransferase family protein [Cyclobacteriaceae bacterium]